MLFSIKQAFWHPTTLLSTAASVSYGVVGVASRLNADGFSAKRVFKKWGWLLKAWLTVVAASGPMQKLKE